MQRLLLYSGHSINQLWNKSWRDIQRASEKKRKGSYGNFQRREKVVFFCFCLCHLLQILFKNATDYCLFVLREEAQKELNSEVAQIFDPVALEDSLCLSFHSVHQERLKVPASKHLVYLQLIGL